MQYSSLILCALSAALALAAPTTVSPPTNVTSGDIEILVSLIHVAAETDEFSEIVFKERHLPDSNSPAESFGPFNAVELDLSSSVKKQDLRCQILDEFLEPIVVVRGENVDITFSDQGKGAWVLRDGEAEVFAVICDQSFVAIKPTSSSSSTSATSKPSSSSSSYSYKPTSSSSSTKYSYSASSTTSKATTSSANGYYTKSSATATSSAW